MNMCIYISHIVSVVQHQGGGSTRDDSILEGMCVHICIYIYICIYTYTYTYM